MKNTRNLTLSPLAAQQGFTLVEMSVVLIVIGLIIGAVTIGRDVQRNAVNQKIASDFVQGWLVAYDSYYQGRGVVVGDSQTSPTGKVNASSTALCDSDLRNAMLAAGVQLPEGRAEGSEDRYVYQDGNGNPHELKICFQNISWSEPGATSGTYTAYNRNTMVLSGVIPSLATQLDAYFDNKVDARFGKFRENSQANSTGTSSVNWSKDDRKDLNGGADNLDESQVVELTANLKMNE